MIFAKERDRPIKGKPILYEVEEFIYGRKDYVTDCPYGECGRYTRAINKVGDLGCNTCEWQVRNNTNAHVVRCAHPEKEKGQVKKLFKD